MQRIALAKFTSHAVTLINALLTINIKYYSVGSPYLVIKEINSPIVLCDVTPSLLVTFNLSLVISKIPLHSKRSGGITNTIMH